MTNTDAQQTWFPAWQAGPLHQLALLVISAIGYFVCARIGYAFVWQPVRVAIVWPASGFMLAMLLLAGSRQWPVLLLGGVLGNIAADFLVGNTFVVCLEGGAANAVEVWLAAWVVIRLGGRPSTLTTLRQVTALIVGGAVLSNALTAFLGMLVLAKGSQIPELRSWLAWWVGDGLGMLLVAPAVIGWVSVVRMRPVVSQRTVVETAAFFCTLVVLSVLVLDRTSSARSLFSLDPYVVMPLLFFAAIRFGPSTAASSTVVLAAITLWYGALGRGPFADAGYSATDEVLRIYAYFGVATLSSLIPSSMLSDRRRAGALVREQSRHAAFVAEVGIALTEGGGLPDMLRRCTAAMVTHLQASHARIWKISDAEPVLELVASTGSFSTIQANARVEIGEFKIGRIAETRRPYITNRAQTDPENLDQAWVRREGVVAFAGYPLILEDRVLGVIVMYARTPLSDQTLESLAAVARAIALGIERSRVEASRARLAAILDAAPDFVTIGRPDRSPLYLNPAFRVAMGIGATEQIDSLLAFRRPEFGAYFLNTLLPAVRDSGSWRGETEYVARDGRVIPVSQVSVMHQDASGDAALLSTISRDISEQVRMAAMRTRAEQGRAESEARYRSLFANMLNGFAYCRMEYDSESRPVDFVYLDVNRAFETLTGLTNVVGRRVSDIIPGIQQVSPELFEIYGRVASTGVSHTFEFDFKSNSQYLTISAYCPEPDHFVAVFEDITERKQAEHTLRLQSAALNAAANAIVITDRDGTIEWVNTALLTTSGYEAAEVIGKNPREVFKSGVHDQPFYKQLWDTLLAGGVWRGEMINRRKDGSRRTDDVTITPIRDAQGLIAHFIAVEQDVTERKALEQQVFRAQRVESIGTLAGGIAHDLNNVLAPIIMSMDLLKLNVTDDDSRELLDTIGASAKRGADIVGQVLAFARGLDGRRVAVHVRQLFREVEEIARETFPKDVVVRATAGLDVWTVMGDPTQLHQVLLNLCINARDAMPSGGQVTLTATNVMCDEPHAAANIGATPGPHVVIGVEDTGVGIPQAIIDKIFDPFFTTKAVGKGTGLGLSTSLTIVKQHGGFLQVTSEPGTGTRFLIFLPASQEGHDGRQESPAPVPLGQGDTILVVDDEAAIRHITSRILQRFGYRVLLASGGTEALALFAQHAADIAVVIVDMMMPGMDGASVIRALVPMNPAVRIIAVSGLAEGHMALPETEAGPIQFLAKPYSSDALLRALQQP